MKKLKTAIIYFTNIDIGIKQQFGISKHKINDICFTDEKPYYSFNENGYTLYLVDDTIEKNGFEKNFLNINFSKNHNKIFCFYHSKQTKSEIIDSIGALNPTCLKEGRHEGEIDITKYYEPLKKFLSSENRILKELYNSVSALCKEEKNLNDTLELLHNQWAKTDWNDDKAMEELVKLRDEKLKSII